MWLIVVYVLHTTGELCLSPVGLSTVTKLAPPRLVGSMMGVWFLAASLGNFVGGRIAGFFETFPLPKLFGAVALTTGASAILLVFLVKPIRNLDGRGALKDRRPYSAMKNCGLLASSHSNKVTLRKEFDNMALPYTRRTRLLAVFVLVFCSFSCPAQSPLVRWAWVRPPCRRWALVASLP